MSLNKHKSTKIFRGLILLSENESARNKAVLTINDFLKKHNKILDKNIENILRLNFHLDRQRESQKLCLFIRIAQPKDANEIVKLFNEIYKGTYPYKEYLDESEISYLLKTDKYEWLLFKIHPDETVGCFGAELDFNNKRGIFHGFVIKEMYQNKVDSLKALFGSLLYFWTHYKDKILIWSCEIRTYDSTSQYAGSLCGLKPVAFFPNKDIFFNKVESDFMINAYDDKVLYDYRKNKQPRLVRQVLNCYTYNSNRYNLGVPIVENPNFELNQEKIEIIKDCIEKQIKKDKYGNETINLTLRNSNSYFRFLYYPEIHMIEKTEYEVTKLEELYVFLQVLKSMIFEKNIRYYECFVSAYKPTHQKLFFDFGFKPRGYVPSWKYNNQKDYFEDQIVFNFFKGTINKEIKLIPETMELLELLNFFDENWNEEHFEYLYP